MGLTKDYLRYSSNGTCNVVASSSTGDNAIAALNDTDCAVASCENVNVYNIRIAEKINEFGNSELPVSAFKYSGNQRFLAIGYNDGELRLYDNRNEDDSSYITFSGHKTGVNCIAFSDDDLILATGGKDSSIVVWDIVNESGLFKLNGHKSTITCLQFTRNGRYLLSSSKDSLMKFWSLDSQNCFYTLTESQSEVYTFRLLRNDTLLLIGSAELELRVFELSWLDEIEQDDLSANIQSKKIKIEDNAYLDDSQENKIMRCTKRGQLIRHSKGRALQFSVTADEKIITCVGSSHVVDFFRVYNAEESEKRVVKKLKKQRKKLPERQVNQYTECSIFQSICDQNLSRNDNSQSISEEDIRKDVTVLISRIGEYRPDAKVKSVDFSPVIKRDEPNVQNYRMFVLFTNNTVYSEAIKVNFKTNEVETSSLANLNQLGHRTDVRCLAMAESGFGFVSGSAESAIVWNIHSLRVSHILKDDDLKDIVACLFVTGDKHVLLATKEGHIFLFELATNESLEVVKKAHDGAIWQLISTPDKKGFISCGLDKKVQYWIYELVNEGVRKRLSVRRCRMLEVPDEALCIAASNDSRFLAVGLLDNTARVHFADTFKFFVSLYGHSLPVTAIHISHDNKLVATGSADKSVKIWGLDFGDCHKSFHAHDDVVTSVLFSPDEHLLWSAGKDGLLKRWDADKFERIQVISLHSAEIRALTQTIDGKYLVSASHDKSIRVWELTDEIIVLQEEQQMEREREYEKRLTDMDDVVPGEEPNIETGLAARKSIMSIKSAEDIIEAVEIIRNEEAVASEAMKRPTHPMIKYLGSASLSHFMADVIRRVPSSHLEKSLLMVPFSYVPDIMQTLSDCVATHHQVELSTRVLLFLIKIHHNHVITQNELLPVLEKLCISVPRGIQELKDICGFNLAALKLLQKEIENRDDVKIFTNVSDLEKKTKRERKTRVKVYK